MNGIASDDVEAFFTQFEQKLADEKIGEDMGYILAMSYGYAVWQGEGDRPSQWLARADRCMYEHKTRKKQQRLRQL